MRRPRTRGGRLALPVLKAKDKALAEAGAM
jgi:hypothetical protein